MKRLSVALLFFVHVAAIAQVNQFYDSSLFSTRQRLAELKDFELQEVSGLAASANNPGYLWVHNDNGKNAKLYLIDDSLHILLTCDLQVIKHRDWEDIAIGPGPDPAKNYIYLGDIGDNNNTVEVKFIYRFEEPVLPKNGSKVVTIKKFFRIPFTTAGIPKDFETLFVDPNTKNLFVASKREKPVHVYVLPYPQSDTDTVALKEIASLELTQLVAGDYSSNGKELLMKNYRRIFYWNNSPAKPIGELLKEEPKIIPYFEEPQGESIAWARNGAGFYTLSKKIPEKKTYLYFYPRKK